MQIVKPSVELLFCTPNSAQLIELSGRVCYKSEDKITDDSANKFVAMINKRGHESVIEHAYATFKIVCDRGISHEIVRHRLASYSQESTRYCNYSKDKFKNEISVIKPFDMTDEQNTCWLLSTKRAEHDYFDMLEAGASPQMARSVLPTCLKTEIVMTANFREWCHFLNLRLHKSAHPQIRYIAYRIWQSLDILCPVIFQKYFDLATEVVKDGYNNAA